MLKKLQQTQQRWGGSSDVIDHWLETRQSLIVEFCQLAALQPANKSNVIELPSTQALQKFSQHLVDYISVGHFKIYGMVMDQWKSTGFVITDDIHQAYARIVLTTDPLLNFTDKYAVITEETILSDFEDDMSHIGEIMTERFEIEDQLIQLIISSLAVVTEA